MPPSDALDILQERMDEKRRAGLNRRLVSVGSASSVWGTVEGRRVLLLASNDYLGLTRHPRLAEAALEASLTQGTGTGASRLVTGTLDAHMALEEEIARFKGTGAALFFSTGYMTNLAVISALAGPGDWIVGDQLNHASLIDACRLSRATTRVYPHGDHLEAARLLDQAPAGALKLLVTDGVFSMDGDLAPLPELRAAALAHGALLVVDDAHGTGVWGATGRGSLEHFGLKPGPETVMIGTFSKALGSHGGFAAGDRRVVDALITGGRPFLYTTAPPPSQVATAREGLKLVDEEPERRERLAELCRLLRDTLAGEGLRVMSEQGPIVPVLAGETDMALRLAAALLEEGVFVPAIRPPTVPPGMSRLRLTLTADHRPEDVENAARALGRAAGKAGLTA